MALFSFSWAAPDVGGVGKSLQAGCQACAGLYQPQQSWVALTCQAMVGGRRQLLHHFWVELVHMQGAVPKGLLLWKEVTLTVPFLRGTINTSHSVASM